MAGALLFVIIIVMIEYAPEVFLAGANLVSIGIIVIKTAPEVLHAFTNFVSIGIVVDGLAHKTFSAITFLLHLLPPRKFQSAIYLIFYHAEFLMSNISCQYCAFSYGRSRA